MKVGLFIWVLHCFQHCTGHITRGSWKGRGNQYIQLVSRFCTVNCRPTASNYQLPHLKSGREPNPDLRGGRQECYHSATVAPTMKVGSESQHYFSPPGSLVNRSFPVWNMVSEVLFYIPDLICKLGWECQSLVFTQRPGESGLCQFAGCQKISVFPDFLCFEGSSKNKKFGSPCSFVHSFPSLA